MINICSQEAIHVMNEVHHMNSWMLITWLPRELVIHTASVILFVLHRDKSQSKTMKYELGIYVSSLTIYGHVLITIIFWVIHWETTNAESEYLLKNWPENWDYSRRITGGSAGFPHQILISSGHRETV